MKIAKLGAMAGAMITTVAISTASADPVHIGDFYMTGTHGFEATFVAFFEEQSRRSSSDANYGDKRDEGLVTGKLEYSFSPSFVTPQYKVFGQFQTSGNLSFYEFVDFSNSSNSNRVLSLLTAGDHPGMYGSRVFDANCEQQGASSDVFEAGKAFQLRCDNNFGFTSLMDTDQNGYGNTWNGGIQTITVANVPLPAAGWLMLAGLGFLGARANKRRMQVTNSLRRTAIRIQSTRASELSSPNLSGKIVEGLDHASFY